MEEFFLSGGPSSSAEVRGLVIHDIKEVEGARQQEQKGDKRDEEIRDEVNGEVEEVTQSAHETWVWRWGEWRHKLDLEPCSVRASIKEDTQRTTTLTDNKKRLRKRRIYNAWWLMHWHQLRSQNAHMFSKCCRSLHILLGFALYFMSSILILVAVTIYSILTCTRIPCRDSHCGNASFEVLSLHTPSVAADRRQLWTILLQQK